MFELQFCKGSSYIKWAQPNLPPSSPTSQLRQLKTHKQNVAGEAHLQWSVIIPRIMSICKISSWTTAYPLWGSESRWHHFPHSIYIFFQLLLLLLGNIAVGRRLGFILHPPLSPATSPANLLLAMTYFRKHQESWVFSDLRVELEISCLPCKRMSFHPQTVERH